MPIRTFDEIVLPSCSRYDHTQRCWTRKRLVEHILFSVLLRYCWGRCWPTNLSGVPSLLLAFKCERVRAAFQTFLLKNLRPTTSGTVFSPFLLPHSRPRSRYLVPQLGQATTRAPSAQGLEGSCGLGLEAGVRPHWDELGQCHRRLAGMHLQSHRLAVARQKTVSYPAKAAKGRLSMPILLALPTTLLTRGPCRRFLFVPAPERG